MPSRFSFRSNEEEIMDDLAIEGQVIDQTLKELEIINRLLGGNQVTVNGVSELIAGSEKKNFSIADIGCGGGDMLKLLARWARKRKLNINFTGVDANPNIVKYAEENSLAFPEISYQVLDIFSDTFQKKEWDVVTATLFTHHFSDAQLIGLLQLLKERARVGIVINDLHRHWFAYHSIKLLTKFFSRSHMVKNDAPVSVLRAFSKSELQEILKKAGVTTYTLQWRWAFRWKLVIRTAK